MQHLTYYDKESTIKRIENVRRLAVQRNWTACMALDYLIDNLHSKKVDIVDIGDLATKDDIRRAVAGSGYDDSHWR